MNHRIALNFEDGVTRFVDCQPGERVAEAAYRSGVNIPLDCREGACGTCRSLCESGRYALDGYVDEALSTDDAAAGYVLTCRMTPLSDCVLRIPVTSDACKVGTGRIERARIADLRALSASSFWLTIEGEAVAGLQFLPGQYANLLVGEGDERRAYSFSSDVVEGRVSFLIRNVPGGLMSGHLDKVTKAGDSLRFQAPYGSFYLRPAERPLLMIAGGTGLAPFLAMLGRLAVTGCGHPVRLVYGVTRPEDLVGLDLLDRLVDACGGFFSYGTCVVEGDAPGAVRGYVTDCLTPAMFNDGDADVYLCGPPPMVAAVESFMKSHDVKPAHLYYERFLPSQ